MYVKPATPEQIQAYRQSRPDLFQKSDSEVAALMKNQSMASPLVRQNTQPIQPTLKDQAIDQAKGIGTGFAAKKATEYGLEQLGEDAANAGGYLAAAKGLYDAGKILDSDMDPKNKNRAINAKGQDVGAGIVTGGIYNIGKFAGDKITGGGFSKVQDKYNKTMLESDAAKVLNPIGYGVNNLQEKAFSMFGSGKGKDQIKRDEIRKALQKGGFLDKDWGIELASGGRYDIGRDGGAKDEFGRNILELDFTNSNAGDLQSVAIGNVNPLAAIITGNDSKLKTDFATYFTKGTMSDANNDPAVIRANAIKQYTNAGLDQPKALQAIKDLEAAGKVTPDEAIAYQNGINMLFGGGGSSQQTRSADRRETSGGSRKNKPKRKTKPSDVAAPSEVSIQPKLPTTLGVNSAKGYSDDFASSLAKLYTL